MDRVALVPETRVGGFAVTGHPASEPHAGGRLDWIEGETSSGLADAEAVAKAGAGVLLLAVSVVEALLGAWSAGWWQRGAVVVLAVVGVAAVARVAAALLRRPASADPHRRAAAPDRIEAVYADPTGAVRRFPGVEAQISVLRSG